MQVKAIRFGQGRLTRMSGASTAGWGAVVASMGWMPGTGMPRARATDSGEAAGLVRQYRVHAFPHDRCSACSSCEPATAARARSEASSNASCNALALLRRFLALHARPACHECTLINMYVEQVQFTDLWKAAIQGDISWHADPSRGVLRSQFHGCRLYTTRQEEVQVQ